MTNIQRCLAQNMKKHRKRMGLSQAALAERAGTAPNYIALIEVGKNFPSLPMLEKIAGALNIDALDLFDAQGLSVIDKTELLSDLIQAVTEAISKTLTAHSVISEKQPS